MAEVRLAEAETGRLSREVIFALSFATAAEGIFLGGILPIIPAIARQYGISSGDAFWINAIFLLAIGVTCPALSRLGDIHGHKKLTIFTLVLSIVGIGCDIVAPTYPVFLFGRFLLGFCPAITPLAIGIFRNALSGEAVLYGIGMIAAAMTAGHAVGPVFASYVFSNTSSIGWVFASWLFLLIPSVLMIAMLVPETPPGNGRRDMDWSGAITLGLGVAALLFAFSYVPKAGWAHPLVFVSFLAGAALLVAWYKIERRTPSPLVNLRMLNDPSARPYYISSFLWGSAYYGSQTTAVLFLVASRGKLGFGFSVSVVMLGWLLLPQHLLNMVGALTVVKIVKSYGGFKSAGLVGGVALVVGFIGMMMATDTLWLFILYAVTTGFGSGILQTTLSARVSDVCEPHQRGISAGMYQTLKSVGGAMANTFGSAVFAAMVIDGTKTPSSGAYMVVFGGCLVASLCIILALAAERPGRMRAVVRADAPLGGVL